MKKRQIILPIAVLMLVFTLALVSAATTLNVPASGTNYTTITFNCTTTTADCDECRNASIFYNASGGITGTRLGSAIANGSADDIDFTGSISIESLSDALTYNFTCEVDNGTDQDTSVGVTSVGVDNTAPSVSVSTDYSQVTLHRFFRYTSSVSDATAGLDGTEACTLTDPMGDTTTLSTSGSNTIFDDTAEPGTYTISCSATDTASNTNSASTTVTVKTTGSPVKSVPDDGNFLTNIVVRLRELDQKTLIIIVVVILIIALAASGKKN